MTSWLFNMWSLIKPLFFATIILSCDGQKPGFASKTSYFAISQAGNNSNPLPAHCSVGLVWFLARHGTRNPSSEDMQAMATRLPKLRDNIKAAWEDGTTGLDSEQVEALPVAEPSTTTILNSKLWTIDEYDQYRKSEKCGSGRDLRCPEESSITSSPPIKPYFNLGSRSSFLKWNRVEIESRGQDLPEEYDLDGCVRLFALCEMD